MASLYCEIIKNIQEINTYDDEICATILKSVDKTQVNFNDEFIYKIDISFSGIDGDIQSAKVQDFIPEYIEYKLPNIGGLIKGIEEVLVEGGTLITFDFGGIEDLGIAITFNIRCKFKLGTDNNSNFTNSVELYINEQIDNIYDAETVTLLIESDFILEKDIVAPSDKEASQGGRVIYTFTLKNKLKEDGGNGDEGAKISNVVIEDIMPDDILLSQEFLPVGYDESGSNISDNRYDEHVGSIDLDTNTMTFNLPEYYGTKYVIILVANIKEDTPIGSEITNTVSWSIDNLTQPITSDTVLVGEDNPGAYITKGCARYADIGDYIRSDINVGNFGNKDLADFIIEQYIPLEYKAMRIRTGSFWIGPLKRDIVMPYEILYQVNDNEYFTLGSYSTDNSQYVNMPQLNIGEKITRIRWVLPNLPVGAEQNQKIYIQYEVLDNNQSNINDVAMVIWNDEGEENTVVGLCNTSISDLSELRLNKSIKGDYEYVYIGDTVTYKLTCKASNSPINNPVISDIISNKLEYLGNEYYTYYDYFDGTTINSNQDGFFEKVPIQKEIIYNFTEADNILIRYTIDNFKITHHGKLTIEYDAKVNVGETGDIFNDATIGTIGDRAIVPNNQTSYLDTDDRDGDLITDEDILITNEVKSTILLTASLSSNKKVKGELDDNYTEEPNVGKTYSGGQIDYNIVIKNEGNVDIESIEIVDILPHIGDNGVILINSQRNSMFNVYATEGITSSIIDENGNEIDTKLIIEYSLSYDPVRFASTNYGNDLIGSVNDWSKNIPESITDVKAIKLRMQEDIKLKANEYISIDIICKAPLGVEENLIAWNSFAVKGSYLDENNQLEHLIPVEPEKVGVEIIKTNKGSIGNFVWIDSDKYGYYDEDEDGINNIRVELYNNNLEFMKSTLSSDNNNGESGYYIFDNLDNGDYYVKFIKNDSLLYTVERQDGGSVANIYTGMSKLIEITDSNKEHNKINAGFIKDIDIIELLLSILHEYIYGLECDTRENLIKSINQIVSILIHYIGELIIVYQKYLDEDEIILDFGYKSQVQRYINILMFIKIKLSSINIPIDYCDDTVLINILYLLINIVLSLITIEEYNIGLIKYKNENNCMKQISFELFMSKYINDITALEQNINDINKVIGILYSQINGRYRPYSPVYIPKKK